MTKSAWTILERLLKEADDFPGEGGAQDGKGKSPEEMEESGGASALSPVDLRQIAVALKYLIDTGPEGNKLGSAIIQELKTLLKKVEAAGGK